MPWLYLAFQIRLKFVLRAEHALSAKFFALRALASWLLSWSGRLPMRKTRKEMAGLRGYRGFDDLRGGVVD